MDSILVIVTEENVDDSLIDAVRRHLTGTDLQAVVCRFISNKQYQSGLHRSALSGRVTEASSIDEIEHAARMEAAEIVETQLPEVTTTAIGMVGSIPDDIVRLATEHDCGHVFVSGITRSPAGKAIFGDDAQQILLTFDGPVTVTTT